MLVGLLLAITGCSDDATKSGTTRKIQYGDWTALGELSNVPTPRINWLAENADGKIITMGGVAQNNTAYYDLIEVFDTATELWEASSAILPSQNQGMFGGVYNGKLYAGGGYYAGWPETVLEYDPAFDTWNDCGGLCAAFIGGNELGASVVLNRKMYVFGGKVDGATVTNGVFEYDIQTNTWTNCGGSCASMPVGRWVNTDVVALNGRIYLTSDTTLEEYDVLKNQWTNCGADPGLNDCAPPPLPVSALFTMHGKIFALNKTDTRMHEYDPASNAWTNCGEPCPRALSVRGDSARVLVQGDSAYLMGALSGDVPTATVEKITITY